MDLFCPIEILKEFNHHVFGKNILPLPLENKVSSKEN
jgi:hypothetical protein